MPDTVYAVGLMSGTSADGCAAALIATDGITAPCLLAHHQEPYPDFLRREVIALYRPGPDELARLARLDRELGRFFGQTALTLIHKAQLTPDQVRVIGSHGQTVRHQPPEFTVQIGSPFEIAHRTGITTVSDFRESDRVLGGEGAPLTPRFHQVLFGIPGRRVAVVNLGGIANLTALPPDPDQTLAAGDCGPANSLIDLLAESASRGAERCDRDGALAATGTVATEALAWLLADPYFDRPYPKSTGRESFGSAFLARFNAAFPDLTAADRMATLTRLTVVAVARDCRRYLPPEPERVVLCGGGVHNPELVRGIRSELPGSEVVGSDQLGVATDSLEAQAFAWFGVRTLRGLPVALPAATGAPATTVAGVIRPGQGERSLFKGWQGDHGTQSRET